MARALLVALLALGALPAAARADPIGATFAFSPAAPLTGQKVTFTGRPTADSEDIATWAWTVDGAYAGNKPAMTWTFTAPGRHTVVLAVEDDDSDQATFTAPVDVTQAPSEASGVGDVTAYLFYGTPAARYQPVELRVVRAGAVAFDRRFPGVIPAGAAGGSSLRVTDLDGDRVPEVVFDYRRGAVRETTVLQGAVAHAHRWGRVPPGRLVAGRGGKVWVSSDGRIRAAFPRAGAPARIVAYRQGRFRDVTRSSPALVRRDAAHWWRLRHRGRTALAPWAADEYSLGHRARVWRAVHGAFARSLRRWLHSHGY
jgi:hypothetical protein